MMEDLSPARRRELLDDFYTECDELFGAIRAQLGELAAAGAAPLRSSAREPLMRALHTLKGNCSIVGLRAAEELAHALEAALRDSTEAGMNAERLGAFSHAIGQLEALVDAHRRNPELPVDKPGPASLPAPLPSRPPATEAPPRPAPVGGQRELWRATFSPSRERESRGVTVDSVRARLTALGEITQAAPQIGSGGSMSFVFTLALGQPPEAPAAWAADGIVFTPAPDSTAAVAPAPETPAPAHVAPSPVVRIDLSRLDETMRILAELVIQRSRLEERIAAVPGARRALQDVMLAFNRSLRDLRGALTRVRLVPAAEIFSRMPFLVEELQRESGKRLRLVLEGGDTEIDKYLVERLREPLLHLVRNAVSHGIETPDIRQAAGKPAAASLTLRASAAGQTVLLEVQDDGAGIDVPAVTRRARELGIELPSPLEHADLLALLAEPEFSTRDSADLAAGRGIGMTVVRNTVRELGGTLSLETKRGVGTTFTLRLPLTLSIVDAIIVSAGGKSCAIPRTFIEEIVQFENDELRRVQNTEVIPYREGVLPVVRLARLLETRDLPRSRPPVLVVRGERGCAGLVVERVQAQREIVVQPLQDPLLQVPGFSGATELGDGRPVLVLDAVALTQGAVRRHATGRSDASPAS